MQQAPTHRDSDSASAAEVGTIVPVSAFVKSLLLQTLVSAARLQFHTIMCFNERSQDAVTFRLTADTATKEHLSFSGQSLEPTTREMNLSIAH